MESIPSEVVGMVGRGTKARERASGVKLYTHGGCGIGLRARCGECHGEASRTPGDSIPSTHVLEVIEDLGGIHQNLTIGRSKGRIEGLA